MFVESDPFNPIRSELTADVLYLRYHLRLDHSEVAEELGISEEGARYIAVQGLKRSKELTFDK